jgi:hypothetical protein
LNFLLDTESAILFFKTATFNHSATPPPHKQRVSRHELLHHRFWYDFDMQKGHVFLVHGAWHVRYRIPGGTQKSEKLTDYNEQYRTRKSVRQLADDVIHRVLHEHRDPNLAGLH